MRTVLHWFRRDLRLHDNTALAAADRRAARVIPVFILEDSWRTEPDVGAARLAFLLRSVEVLRRNLETLGYPLVVRHGRAEVELPRLCREAQAEAVFCNRCYEPHAQALDGRVFQALNAGGIGFELFKDAVAWEEREILTRAGQPYTVFTPYARAWRQRRLPPPSPRLRTAAGRFPALRSDPLPSDPAAFGRPLRQTMMEAGEAAALKTLEEFVEQKLPAYALARDFPARDGTSRLSVHLHAGTIGIRTVLARLDQARARRRAAASAGADIFLQELIWREFYLQILANFPHVARGAFRPEYDRLAWSENDDHFRAWCDGRTGYPIVDAAMRGLNATGWMHNRLRMIVAMFLTKDLLLSWQWGERYFMQQLIDGDLAANNGGWQWSAGTGTDAAPYFRIFNPVAQGAKFDPEGAFVRAWLPELAAVPARIIHQPWADPELARGLEYPPRIVLHEAQRTKCLAMFQTARRRARPPVASAD